MRSAAWLVVGAWLCAGAGPAAAQASGAGRRLSLADAVGLATESAPAVQAAGYRVEGAAARVRETRADLLPALTATAGYVNRSATLASTGFSFPPGLPFSLPALIGPYDNVDGRLRVSQTLFDYAEWRHLAAARLGVEGSAAERAASVQAAARAAALAYLAAVRAASLLAARRADADIAAELLSLAQAQLQAGVSAPLDVTRARTQLAAAQAALIVARNQRQKADINLALALGDDPGTTYTLADTLTGDLGASAASADTAGALPLALERRPDLVAEETRGRHAEVERGAILAERLPRLDVAADFGANGRTPDHTLNTRSVALVVTVPFLDGFRRSARSAAQAAAVRESAVRSRDLRRHIAAEVRAALLDIASGAEQHEVTAQRLALATEELSEARERFASGIAGNIDVINAQASLNQARDGEIDARYATAAARVGLAYATGVADTVH
jgi:outer membrane protein TolC